MTTTQEEKRIKNVMCLPLFDLRSGKVEMSLPHGERPKVLDIKKLSVLKFKIVFKKCLK
jgi:hypothetical protein